MSCVIVAAAALAAGCAAVPPERAAVDVRAAAARTPAEHRAVAAEYEALAQLALKAAQRYASHAQQDRATENLIDRARERPDRPRAPYIRPPWELDAQAEIQAAEEMRAAARHHRDMAAQAR